MIRAAVERSRENEALSRWELGSAVAAVGGDMAAAGATTAPGVDLVDLPDRTAAVALGGRLALARRVVVIWTETEAGAIAGRLRRELREGDTVSIRRWGSARGPPAVAPLRPWVDAAREARAAVDLDAPSRRFWYAEGDEDRLSFGEEVAAIDRGAYDRRRMPTLPFRRPVSLPPRLGRVAANLARVRPGDRVVDPFLGSGALAIESALLGARVVGLDSDPTMVRGAIANFAHLSLTPDGLIVGDAGAVEPEGTFDALVTDPPYGRASSTGGEGTADLLRRVLARWAPAVRPDGRVVVVVPGGPDPLDPPWRRLGAVADRVHRSLTREFRVYARDGATTS